MRTQLRRPFVALAVLVVTVLTGGIAAAVTRGSDAQSAAGATRVLANGGDRRTVVNSLSGPDGLLGDAATVPTLAPPTTSVPVPTTAPVAPAGSTTTTATATSTTLAPPPPPPPPPATTAVPTTTTHWTVAPPPTPPSTVAPPPGPASATYSLSPTSGPSNTLIVASGTGCVPVNGHPTGIELYISDPSGRPFNGDGGAAMPDGTWTLPTSFSGAPGVYSLLARCALVNGPAVFDYPVATFTITR